MDKPKLFYDANCFICSNYVRILKLYIPADKLDYEPITGDSSEIAYQSVDGIIYHGHEGIDKLLIEVPETLKYFGMVPYEIRSKTAHAMYTLGSAVRSVIRKVSGGCNCGR